ncbi:hypothetical protein HK405_010747 [Cladochytrium tenue]|nr:hypothetical protein HK405_010747 [Cladochytrium tenue]
MGGKALSRPSVRLPAAEFVVVRADVLARLATCPALATCRFAPVPAYRDKPDYGDLDVLVADGPTQPRDSESESDDEAYDGVAARRKRAGILFDTAEIARALNAVETVRTGGPVTSYGIMLAPTRSAAAQVTPAAHVAAADTADSGRLFQVDLIAVRPAAFDFTLAYYAFNDLGAIIGAVARRLGFKLSSDGLHFVVGRADHNTAADIKADRGTNSFDDGLGDIPDGHALSDLPGLQQEDVLVSRDWDACLDFLGYDPTVFRRAFTAATANDFHDSSKTVGSDAGCDDDNSGSANAFRNPEDLFRFAVSSIYFSPSLFLPATADGAITDDNANTSTAPAPAVSGKARRRRLARPVFAAFVEWLAARHTLAPPAAEALPATTTAAATITGAALARARREFPRFDTRLSRTASRRAAAAIARSKLAAAQIAAVAATGAAGPTLGMAMRRSRERFSAAAGEDSGGGGGRSHYAVIAEMSDREVVDVVIEEARRAVREAAEGVGGSAGDDVGGETKGLVE